MGRKEKGTAAERLATDLQTRVQILRLAAVCYKTTKKCIQFS